MLGMTVTLKLFIFLCFTSTYPVRRSFINGAFKSTTNQHPQGTSWLAVDGQAGTRTTVGPAAAPWWKVDLGREGLVTGVRLSLDVEVKDSSPGIIRITILDTNKKAFLCASIDVTGDVTNKNLAMYCPKPLLGRFVKVQMSVSGDCKVPACEYTIHLNDIDVILGKKTISYINLV